MLEGDALGFTIALVLLGVPTFLLWWGKRGKIKVCIDPIREIMCDYLTPEEYDQHLEEQRKIERHIRTRRCARQLGPGCV